MKYIAIVFVALSLMLGGCFRSPRLMPGMYVTYDGRVQVASPELVRVDTERRLSTVIGKTFQLTANPRVTIGSDPALNQKGHHQWSGIAVQVEQLSDLEGELHKGDLREVIGEQLKPLLVKDAEVAIVYLREAEPVKEEPNAP